MYRVNDTLHRGGNTETDVNIFDLEENAATPSPLEPHMICFLPGTGLATPLGEILVEDLQQGDRILTRDNGIQTLAWVGHRHLGARDLRNRPDDAPICIRKGALNGNAPERDLWVSPNHRMLINSSDANTLFGEHEVLIPAQHLTYLDGVEQCAKTSVQYIHLLFEHHEIVLANGAWTESFQPDESSLNGITQEHRAEIIRLFPELDRTSGPSQFPAARQSLNLQDVLNLSVRLAS